MFDSISLYCRPLQRKRSSKQRLHCNSSSSSSSSSNSSSNHSSNSSSKLSSHLSSNRGSSYGSRNCQVSRCPVISSISLTSGSGSSSSSSSELQHLYQRSSKSSSRLFLIWIIISGDQASSRAACALPNIFLSPLSTTPALSAAAAAAAAAGLISRCRWSVL